MVVMVQETISRQRQLDEKLKVAGSQTKSLHSHGTDSHLIRSKEWAIVRCAPGCQVAKSSLKNESS
jgi:hypothetical protein